jgi:hypothetical protein
MKTVRFDCAQREELLQDQFVIFNLFQYRINNHSNQDDYVTINRDDVPVSGIMTIIVRFRLLLEDYFLWNE